MMRSSGTVIKRLLLQKNKRMREGHCNVESSILYSEMLTDYERIGDHMLNIGEAYDAIQWNSDKAAALAEE